MLQILRERHDPPPSVVSRLLSAGGSNPFNEPNYRVVWGWNRLSWIGGKFEDRSPTGALLREVVELRLEPKYPQLNRWHLERWFPPETYGSPRAWYAQTIERSNGLSIPALGPYPSRGDYEHCFTLETPRGEFLPLTPAVVEYLVRTIEFSRAAPRARRRESLLEREARDDRAYSNWAFDLLDDQVPAFHDNPFVPVSA